MSDETKEYETEVVVNGLRCIRCGHSWIPRKAGERPLTCPKCHSSYWHRPRVRKIKASNPEVKTE